MSTFVEKISGINSRNKLLIVGLLTIITLSALLYWWVLRPSYRVLFSGLNAQNVSRIESTLTAFHIPYRVNGKGDAVLVPGKAVSQARMRLAAQGLPTQDVVGLELFDKSNYGVTDFAQQVEYQRALQGELERTISSLSEVEKVRVHLTLKPQGLFLGSDGRSKAAVEIKTRPGMHLTTAEVYGIRHLVAAAVHGLKAANVVVIDGSGNPLSIAGSHTGGMPGGVAERMREEHAVESAIRERIARLLRQGFGISGANVAVAVDLDFSRISQTENKILPYDHGHSGLLVSKQERDIVPTGKSTKANKSGNSEMDRSVDVRYAYGQLHRKTSFPVGRIRKIDVGVILPRGFKPGTIQHLKQLIFAVAGLDKSRGDRLAMALATSSHSSVSKRTQAAAALSVKQPETASEGSARVAEIPRSSPMPSWDFPLPVRWSAIVGLVLLLIMTLFLVILRRRRFMRVELSAVEEEQLSAALRQWLGGE